MNEDKTRDLIKDSLLHTSDQFTENFMRRVEFRDSLRRNFFRIFVISCLCCMIFVFLISKIKSNFAFPYIQLHIPHLTIQISGVLFVFALLNRLILLREKILKLM
jgi:hypothetical protein